LNAVEIETAISHLAEQAFDPASWPYAFLEAFGNKATTIKRLQSGSSNASDIEGGVLQRSNIHIAVCANEEVTVTLNILKASPATITDLYDPEKMPENLRHAHERNDEVLERIYVGRHFKNDTERLEKLFELYTKMTAGGGKKRATQGRRS
jgi:hypothetical protein